MTQAPTAPYVPPVFGMFLTQDGTALLVGDGQSLPEHVEATFGPWTDTRLVSSDHPVVQPRLHAILSDLDESGYAVL